MQKKTDVHLYSGAGEDTMMIITSKKEKAFLKPDKDERLE
jgi:hypothetical protein